MDEIWIISAFVIYGAQKTWPTKTMYFDKAIMFWVQAIHYNIFLIVKFMTFWQTKTSIQWENRHH